MLESEKGPFNNNTISVSHNILVRTWRGLIVIVPVKNTVDKAGWFE